MTNKSSIWKILIGLAALLALAGCTGNIGGNPGFLSYEEFRDTVERRDDGVFIIDGDLTVLDETELREIYDVASFQYLSGEEIRTAAESLIINRTGSSQDAWSASQAQNLTYCVTGFSSSLTATVRADMAAASANWEAVANVNFTEVSSCTSALFRVIPASSSASYVASAFFPSYPSSYRKVDINTSYYAPGALGVWTMAGVLTHELGHVLGFRHEHTRYSSLGCYEDSNWYPLTDYDSNSVMHYPHCNGTQSGDLRITTMDAAGAASVYGAPGGGTPPPPPPPPPPSTGCPSGYSQIDGALSGTGDADTYTYTTVTTSHDFILIGPSGTDFDLYLYRSNTLRASSTSSSSNEEIHYSGSANKIRVTSYSGSGNYTLCYNL